MQRRYKRLILGGGLGLCLSTFCFGQKATSTTTQTAPATDSRPGVQEAVNARTDAMVLQEQANQMDPRMRRMLRGSIGRAEGELAAGTILLNKDRHAEAIASFRKAERYFRDVQNGRRLLQEVAEAQRKTLRARMLAEAAGAPDETRENIHRRELNAEGFVEAGEFKRAADEFDKARKAYEALLKAQKPATLEETVDAQGAMLAARKDIRGLPRLDPKAPDPLEVFLDQELERSSGSLLSTRKEAVRKGSAGDVMERARATELTAMESLDRRDYSAACLLFGHAQKLYSQLGRLQAERDRAFAAEDAARQAMRQTDNLFPGEARPASFVRGQEALADGHKALEDDQIDKAIHFFSQAQTSFQEAQEHAHLLDRLSAARQAWSAAINKNPELLQKYARQQAKKAKDKATRAEGLAVAGLLDDAVKLYAEASRELEDAASEAAAQNNLARAQPVIELLDAAIRRQDKFEAESRLTELSKLIPRDAVTARLRGQADALPWPKTMDVELEAGTKIEFMLVAAGRFMMGSTQQPDERPVFEVHVDRPFYLGRYEVTQAQWRAVMGHNPSRFAGQENPVEKVSWEDCHDFLRKLTRRVQNRSFRLPSEAEWEYAWDPLESTCRHASLSIL